ncbi:MAG: hypothetical protein GY937_08225 [bacterium]|nr:hypothetical protein [bacterium]
MKRLLLIVLAAVVLVAACLYGLLRWYGWRSQDPTFFEDAIAAFEAEDQASAPAHPVVLFTGSSSVRLWSSLAEDMAPIPVLNRGFGGSQMSHVVHYAERIIHPYRPVAVVVYAGDNDLAPRTGKTAETVLTDFQELVRRVHAILPETRIYYLTIKPSRLRWDRWPEMERANQQVALFAASDPLLGVIDIGPATLGPDGTPRDDFFRIDGLHLNATGYAAWTEIVRPALLADPAIARILP